MKQLTEFPIEVSEALKYYVYRLIDPHSDKTFYVGKGTGNRVFQHLQQAEKLQKTEGKANLKVERINEIRSAGMEIKYVIHRHGLTEDQALLVEAVLIDAYPELTNLQGGHYSDEFGLAEADKLIIKYGLPKLTAADLKHRLVLINVNSHPDPFAHLLDKEPQNPPETRSMLDQVRFAWRVDMKRVEQADYVLAVWRGIVVGAYLAHEWLSASKENFGEEFAEEFTTDEKWEELSKRKAFRGEKAPTEIWQHYVGDLGKRIVAEGAEHNQYPIRYWEPPGQR